MLLLLSVMLLLLSILLLLSVCSQGVGSSWCSAGEGWPEREGPEAAGVAAVREGAGGHSGKVQGLTQHIGHRWHDQ